MGRVPGSTGLGGGAGLNVPGKNPGGVTPLKSSGPEIIEPDAVYEHLISGVLLHRCGKMIFDKSKGSPSEYDVRQGAVLNCPLPAFLAAMVHTKTFNSKIKIAEIKKPAISVHGSTRTDVTRYFEIKFPDNPDEEKYSATKVALKLTDRFWGSGACEMTYARCSKKDLWVSLVEKAFVKIAAGNTYERLNDANKGPDANEVIEIMFGVDVSQVVSVKGKSDKELEALFKKAETVPMIIRWANPNNNQAHAVTVEGLDPVDNVVNWIDSLSGTSSGSTLKQIRDQFDYVLHP